MIVHAPQGKARSSARGTGNSCTSASPAGAVPQRGVLAARAESVPATGRTGPVARASEGLAHAPGALAPVILVSHSGRPAAHPRRRARRTRFKGVHRAAAGMCWRTRRQVSSRG